MNNEVYQASEMFTTELNYIQDESIKHFAVFCLNSLPKYFTHVPASTSGKYHPAYALGEGGLTRHVRATVGFAMDLFRAEIYNFNDLEKDIIITSLLLHDGCKCGLDDDASMTVFEHPTIMASYLCVLYDSWKSLNQGKISLVNIVLIADNIESHSGKWITSKYSESILPAPVTTMQKFVHLCDYLASRKQIIYDFDAEQQLSDNS